MSKTLRIILFSLLGMLLIGYLIGVRVFYNEFLPNTYLHGVNIGTMTESEAVQALTDAVHPVFKVKEIDGRTEAISLKEIKFVSNYEETVHNMMETVSPWTWPISLIKDTENTTGGDVSFDAHKLKELVHNLEAISGSNIKAPVNAYITQKNGNYEIVKEDDGNTLNEDKAFGAIKYALIHDEGTVDLDKKDCYLKATVRQDDENLRDTLSKIHKLNSLTITINMVDKDEVLTCDKIVNMGTFSAGRFRLDEEKLNKYLDELAEKYNTYRKKRPFVNHAGNTIDVGGGYDTLGFSMSKEETAKRITEAVNDKKDAKIDAAWDVAGVTRDEKGCDVGTTYVEVSIADQHLWYYRGGEVIMDCDVVTGLTNGTRNTPAGVYKIWSKERNATLRGQDYATPVSYWMPITWTGVGLHDANWRGSFGGSIYRYNGSHGCVNMPPSRAGELFNEVALNTPVVVY